MGVYNYSMFKLKKYLILLATFFPFIPFIVFAAERPQNFKELIAIFMNLLNMAIPVLVSLAILTFLIGIAIYIWKGASESERIKGRQFMFWGVIGLFVMVSFFGLVKILENTFFSNGSGQSEIYFKGKTLDIFDVQM